MDNPNKGFSMDPKVYQELYELCSIFLNDNFEKAILIIFHNKFPIYPIGRYDAKLYQKNKNSSKFIYTPFNDFSYLNFDKIIQPEYMFLEEKYQWKVMIMRFTNDGKLKVNFEYEDNKNKFMKDSSYIKKYYFEESLKGDNLMNYLDEAFEEGYYQALCEISDNYYEEICGDHITDVFANFEDKFSNDNTTMIKVNEVKQKDRFFKDRDGLDLATHNKFKFVHERNKNRGIEDKVFSTHNKQKERFMEGYYDALTELEE